MQKSEMDVDPPQGGWWIGSKEPIGKYFSFYWKKLQYQKTEINPLDSYMEWDQRFTNCEIAKFWEDRDPLGVSNGPKMLSRQHLLLFSVIPAKKKKAYHS